MEEKLCTASFDAVKKEIEIAENISRYQIVLLKKKIAALEKERNEYKEQAIWWAKQADEYRYSLQKVEAWCETERMI